MATTACMMHGSLHNSWEIWKKFYHLTTDIYSRVILVTVSSASRCFSQSAGVNEPQITLAQKKWRNEVVVLDFCPENRLELN